MNRYVRGWGEWTFLLLGLIWVGLIVWGLVKA